MSQQIESSSSYNYHDSLLGTYQHGGTNSLETVNIIRRRMDSDRDSSGIGIWLWYRNMAVATI